MKNKRIGLLVLPFAIAAVVIAILLPFILNADYSVFRNMGQVSFVGLENYLRLFLHDPTFIKALFNTFFAFEILFLLTMAAALLILRLTKGLSRRDKGIAAAVCGVAAVLLLLRCEYVGLRITGLLLKLRGPAAATELSTSLTVTQVVVAVTVLAATLSALFAKSALRGLADEGWIRYAIVAATTVGGFALCQRMSAFLLGYPGLSYAVTTVEIAAYVRGTGVFNLLMVFALAAFHCVLLFCGERIVRRFRTPAPPTLD